ncbi:hypothetical protein L6452_09452 [Arctium lappa]|uniref:Uncharacterized protein n=1 Tax=Arctium lappa TaxID=4217 RepID=A0ACB9DKQ6_ARCLA|nr:hypothetical protein L6452_09452 [Arctium lappa]
MVCVAPLFIDSNSTCPYGVFYVVCEFWCFMNYRHRRYKRIYRVYWLYFMVVFMNINVHTSQDGNSFCPLG